MDSRFPELVRWLAPYHLEHFFRYRKGSGFHQFPPASEAADIIVATIVPIEQHVRQQFAKSQNATRCWLVCPSE
jgi:hypothetical protein